MLTARNVILVSIIVAVLSIVLSVISLMQTPDNGELGGDSFGTRAHGNRALYEILGRLGIPVERSMVPPGVQSENVSTLVFWNSHAALVQLEPTYLRSVSRWIRSGGRVVVAPSKSDSLTTAYSAQKRADEDEDEEQNEEIQDDENEQAIQTDQEVEETDANDLANPLLEELGLAGLGVEVRLLDLTVNDIEEDSSVVVQPTNLPDETSPDEDDEELKQFQEGFRRAFFQTAIATRTVPVTMTGQWAAMQSLATALELPEEDLQVLELGSAQPEATIGFELPSGEQYVLAALFRLEKGSIVVVADPAIAQNRNIARADNSVVLAHLLSDGTGEIVFEEFYHGLTIRGNPLWLFTRQGYGATSLALLFVIGVWAWREAVFLGPPLDDTTVSRRSIAEYIDAMGRLFNTGKNIHPFYLQTVRDGVLWSLRNGFGLQPGHESSEEIVAVMARRDLSRSQEFSAAIDRVDQLLSNERKCNEKETVIALRKVIDCL